MVGGKVIGIARKADRTTLHVRCSRSTDQVCVDCIEERLDGGGPIKIQVGDSAWWQGGFVMWTPDVARHKFQDIQLRKVGYTHSFSHALAGEPNEGDQAP